MEVRTERQDGTLVAEVEGRIDGVTAREFEDTMKSAISEEDAAVIMDLEGVSYVSSAGLRAILLIAKDLGKRDAKFALCSLAETDWGGLRYGGIRQDHQDSPHQGGGADRDGRRLNLSLAGRELGRVRRQIDDHFGKRVGLGIDPDTSPMLADDVVRQGKAQPGALVRRLGGEKRIEYLVDDVGWNAAAVVANADFETVRQAPGRQPQPRLIVRRRFAGGLVAGGGGGTSRQSRSRHFLPCSGTPVRGPGE